MVGDSFANDILFGKAAGIRTVLLDCKGTYDGDSDSHGQSPDYVVDRFQTALTMVAAGLGVMVVPSIIEPACPAGVRLIDFSMGWAGPLASPRRGPNSSTPSLPHLNRPGPRT